MFCIICIILEISSLLSKDYPGLQCACVMDNIDLRMVSLKGDRFLQFTISSGNEFQSLMVAGKKECLKVSVVQIGSLSDFE